MRDITGVVIHCTATHADWRNTSPTADKVAEVKRWHLARGWSDIGYHFLIDRDGTVAKGRPITRDGAHVAGHNKGTIGISLFGGHGSSETDQFSDNFTAAQDAALRGLLVDLRKSYGDVPITGHNEYAAKACPGFRVKDWLAQAPETPAQAEVEKPWVNPAVAALDEIRAIIAKHDANV